jgi:hypothetical protein
MNLPIAHDNVISVHPIGALIALFVAGAIGATIYWMLHPPHSNADMAAEQAEAALQEMVGSIIVVFAEEIRSEHMMVLAARLARRESADSQRDHSCPPDQRRRLGSREARRSTSHRHGFIPRRQIYRRTAWARDRGNRVARKVRRAHRRSGSGRHDALS